MRTRTGPKTARRRPSCRLRPHIDRLDARLVLSGSALGSSAIIVTPALAIAATPPSPTLSIVSTSPANSSVLTTSPSTLVVAFDRPIDDFSVANNDFELVHVAGDGSKSPLGSEEATLGEALDPDGSQVDLSLSGPLALGHYELLLGPGNGLAGVDGTSVTTPASGLVLADFKISPPREGPDSAIDLNKIGPQQIAVSGQLDLASDPGAVQYYKFELTPGHQWQVGLGTSPMGTGGTLDTAISLFDSQGHLISTDNQGPDTDPNATSLSAGLDPGTYYVGISAQKNIPDASGHYRPYVSGGSPDNPGGAFQLDLLANPADQSTRLIGLQVDHADPVSTAPTGLTLRFSAGIDIQKVVDSSDPTLTLVDRAGSPWTVTPIAYDASQDQLSVAFDRPLPPGTYAVDLAGPRSLLDLSGRAPVGSGFPAGTLGSFDVTPSTPVAGDLGAILPGLGVAGVGTTVNLDAGRPTTLQFVTLQSGFYGIEGISPDGGVSYSIEDPTGKVLATGPGSSGAGAGANDFVLNPGVYQVVLSGGPRASQVSFSIFQARFGDDALIESGVSQAPAVDVRLVTPQADLGRGSGSSTTLTNASGSLVGVSTAALNSTSGGIVQVPGAGLVSPVGPSVAGGTYSAEPVGRPSGKANSIGVVGLSGRASIASNSPDLPAGLFAVQPPVEADEPVGPEPSTTRTGITLESGLLARSPGSRRADERSLADTDWIGRIVGRALDWLESAPVEALARGTEPASSDPTPSEPTEPAPAEGLRVESASMASPAGLSLTLGMVAYGYGRRVFSRKGPPGGKDTKSGFRPILVGPHRHFKARVR